MKNLKLNEYSCIFRTCRPVWKQFEAPDVHNHLLTSYEFCASHRIDIYTLPWSRELISVSTFHI